MVGSFEPNEERVLTIDDRSFSQARLRSDFHFCSQLEFILSVTRFTSELNCPSLLKRRFLLYSLSVALSFKAQGLRESLVYDLSIVNIYDTSRKFSSYVIKLIL